METYQYEDGYSLTLSREIKTIEGDKNAPTIQIFQDKDLQNNIVKSGYLNRNLEYATIYEYDYTGKMKAQLTAKDKEQGCDYTIRYETDYDGNILSQTSDKNTVTKYQYDLMGRVISITDPNGNTAQYTYNEQSQLIEAEIPLTSNSNTIKKYQYDPKGNMTKQSISSSQPGETIQYRDTYYEYNQRDFLVKVTNLDDEQEYYTEYTYDAAGNLTSTATGNGANITSYTYNSLNQLIELTDPMGESETYSYDLNNNLIGRTDRNQNRLTITYNALNQPLKTTVIQPDGKVLSQENSYAVNGAVIKEENENIKTSFYYDNQGRIIKEEDNTGTAQTYTYDLAGNRLDYQLKQNSQSQINLTYTYDKQNRLTEVKENNSLAAAYSYDPNGNCTLIQYDNGIQTNLTYNNANMITQMNNKIGETTLSGYTCTYYLDGNQESKTDHQNQLTTYEYDGLGRLKTETEADINTQYTYDLSGNRIKKYISGTTPVEINYLYDKNDRLIWEETETEDNTIAATEYYYDANGNQISKIYNDLTEQSGAVAGISLEPRTNTLDYEYYEYDGFNRLTSYLTPTTTAEYTYNTKGLRISKTVNGQETRHIWDGSNIVMELNGSDQVIDKYIRGTQLIKSDLNGYYLYNNHGDVIQLTDQQGTVTTSYLYDAFGIEQEPQPNDPNPFRYCGEYLDKESGNVYLRARYYDPETGRFISEDPIRDGLNWYVYCSNDPVNFIDPRGLAIGDVTMPNGDVIHGTITDGTTHLPDGSRPPEGAVVETAAGFYMMLNGSGVEVTPTSVTTSSGSNVTGYNAGGTTYMLGGSRPTVGSTVHTSGGDYIMTASGIGNKVYSGSSSSSSSSSKYNPYDIMSVSKSCGGALVDTCNEPNTKQAIINTGLLAYDQIRRITQVPIVGTKLKLKLPYINSGDPEFEEARKQADKWTAFSPSSWFRP